MIHSHAQVQIAQTLDSMLQSCLDPKKTGGVCSTLVHHITRMAIYFNPNRLHSVEFALHISILYAFDISDLMGPKQRPVPKPHAMSVIATIIKTIKATPKPRPPLRPPPRSLRIISGYPQATLSSSSRTQAIPQTQTDSDSFESGVQRGLGIDLEHLDIPECLKFPLSGRILPADPAPLKDKTEVERSVQNQRILDILKEFHDVSTVAHQLGQSKFPELHMQHLLRNLEPETVKRHLNKFLHFVSWLKFDGGITMEAIQPFHIADYLMDTVPAKKNAEWRFKPAIGSLTWTSKTLGLQQLANSLESDLIKSFFASKSRPPLNPDIMPVTLGLIFTLETLLKQSDVAIAALPLGAFLLMFWAGLRYSDIQRVFVADIQLSDGILRGKTWKSKSRKTGMSFSCITAGLTGTHSKNWASIWLSHLTKWWSDLSKSQGVDWKPDFLIPPGVNMVETVLGTKRRYQTHPSWIEGGISGDRQATYVT